MTQPFQSGQHKRRLRVDEWPLEAAYRRVWEMVGQANRRLHDETRRLKESEGQAMVGGTGGPRENDGNGSGDGGMRTETCSVCDGKRQIMFVDQFGWPHPIPCRACGGTGKITYRTARQVVRDAETARAERDRTLEAVARIRAAAVARDVDALPADAQKHLNIMRRTYAEGAKWHGKEDR